MATTRKQSPLAENSRPRSERDLAFSPKKKKKKSVYQSYCFERSGLPTMPNSPEEEQTRWPRRRVGGRPHGLHPRSSAHTGERSHNNSPIMAEKRPSLNDKKSKGKRRRVKSDGDALQNNVRAKKGANWSSEALQELYKRQRIHSQKLLFSPRNICDRSNIL